MQIEAKMFNYQAKKTAAYVGHPSTWLLNIGIGYRKTCISRSLVQTGLGAQSTAVYYAVMHSSNHIIKCADVMSLVGLISKNKHTERKCNG